MNSRDYVITLILKARDEIAGAVAKALAEVEGLNKLAEKNGFKDLDADADRLSNTLRNKLGNALSEVRGNLNRTEADADKFERRYKSLGSTVEEAGRKFKRFDIDETGRKLRRAETDAKAAGDELERLGKRTKANGDEWDRQSSRLDKANARINDHSSVLKEAEKSASQLMKVTGQLGKLEADHTKALEKTRSAYDKQIESAAKLKVARDRLSMNPLDRDKVDFKALDREIEDERRKAAELGAEVEALSKLHPTINIDLDTAGFKADATKLKGEKDLLGKDIHVNVDMDIGGAEAKLIAFNATKNRATSAPKQTSMLGWFRDLGQEAEENTHSIAAFDNALRGLAILTVVAMSQQLLTIMTALGGEIIAVASSAILAGSAIGGALTAGIAQALPAVGLLVSAFARVGAVISAIKQTETLAQQESYSGEKQEGKSLGAEEGVVNATEAVIAAKQNLRLAEISLTKARFEARRELQDLVLAEKQAELAAKGAALSQFQAQMTLREAIRSGNISEVAGAQLEVASSRLTTQQATISAGRASQDLSLQERGSPLSPNQGIPDAERQVEQSVKALKQSERAAISAKRAATEAATQGLAAAGKLNYMLGELDESERRLYKGARRLYQVYKEVTRPITDTIIDAFTYATNKGVQILKNPQLTSAFDSLAGSIGGSFKRVVDEFSSPEWIKFFSTMTKEAGENIGPLTTAFLSMAGAFKSIAEAASPILHDIVGWLAEGADEFEQWVGKGKSLRDFFKEGEHALEAWLGLAGSILHLFLALIGVSAKEGTSQVESLTDRINEATNYIEKHRKKVEGFFNDVGDVMSVVGEVLLALGAEILRVFNVESVEDLGDILIKVVIPALGEAVILFGKIGTVLAAIANNPAGEFMLKFLASILVLKSVLSPFVSVLKGAVIQISKIAQMGTGLALSLAGISTEAIAAHGAFNVLKARMAGYSAAQIGAAEAGVPLMASLEGVAAAGAGVSLSMLAIPAAMAAVFAAFIYLSDQFGVLDDQLAAFQEVGEGFIEPIIEPFGEFVDQLMELLGALGIVGSQSKGLGAIFEFVFVKVVKAGVIPTIKFFGSQLEFIGELIGGVLKIATGALEILTGIFTLNFDKIVDGAKKMLDGFTTPFRALFNRAKRLASIGLEVLRELFGGTFRWIGHRAEAVGDAIAGAFHSVIKFFGKLGGRILGAITGGFGAVWNWLQDLPDKMAHFASRAVSKVVNAFESLGSKILHAIGSIADQLFTAGKKLGSEVARGLHQAIKDTPLLGKALELGEGALGFAGDAVGSLNPFAKGGPVGTGFGTKDDQLGVLTRGEHVLTTEDVKNAGGHEAIFAWRRSLGSRGGQGGRGRYAEGGEVKAGQLNASSAEGNISLETLLALILTFGGEAAEAWNEIWSQMQKRTGVGINSIETKFDGMERSLIQSSKRINNQVVKSFDSMLDTVKGNVNELTQAVYKGMMYVVNSTNEALKAFGAKPVELNVPKPGGGKDKAQKAATGGFIGGAPKRMAAGGWIGNMGERGADMIATWLGRGEAVLNWGHQKIVDPAMRAVYGFGLGEMFDRSHGEHAAGGMPGFSGGFAGQSPSGNTTVPIPGFPGEFIASQVLDEALKLVKMFRLTITDAFATAGHVGAGHLSSGTAMDVVPGAGGSWDLVDKAVAYARSKGMTVLYNGVEGHGRGHHAHIELEDGAITGAILAMLGGKSGKVDKVKVKGDKGSFMEIAQGAISKAQKAAVKLVSEKSLTDNASYGLKNLDIQGSVAAIFAKVSKMLGAPFRAVLALFEAGLAESGMRDLGYGDATSEGALQLLSSTASGLGVDPHDEDAVAQLFLKRGFWGKGGAIQLARSNPDMPAHAIAQNVQGSGAGEASEGASNYGVQKAAALALMRRYGFKIPASFATGGVVGGEGGVGRKIPIFAHLGEWILNQRQQSRMAAMLGTTVDKLKGMLGFSGGPTSFAGGGEPKEGGSEAIAVDRGKPVSALPLPNLENYSEALKFYLSQVNKELKRGGEGVDKKRKNLSDFLSKLFTRIAADLEEMQNGWETIQSVLTTQMNKFRVRIGKGGKVLGRKGQAEEIVNLEIKQIGKELDYLYAEKGPILKSLRLAQKALRKARKEGDTAGEQTAQAGIKKFRDMRRELAQQTSETQVAMLEKMEQRQAEQVTRINEDTERTIAHRGDVGGQLDALGSQEAGLNKVLGKAKKSGNVELQHQIEQELEAIEGAKVEAQNKAFERRLGSLTTTASIQSAMGFGDAANATTAGQIPIWQEQKSMLESALGRAQSQHNAALADQIRGEIQGLEVSIAEAAAALISQAGEAIETRAARAQFGIDLGNRIVDLRERFGGAPQRQEERGGLLRQETGVIASQLAETQSLLAKAQSEGFGPDVIIPLQEKVGDLGVKLEENSAAIYSNTIAVRQAYIDQIQERQGFMGGITGNLEQIVTGLGSLSGVVNSGKLTELIKAAGQQLSGSGWELRGQLGAFVGERLAGTSFGESINALAGLHGEELVAAVQNLDFKGIENFLGPGSEASKQFQALIQAILENEVAIIGNTKQLEEAMQQNQIQSFTSSAWSWFRKAIFTGMGGLMPEYSAGTPFYEAATGGEMLNDGPVKLHRGELIIPNNFSTILRSLARAGSIAGSIGTGSMPASALGANLASTLTAGGANPLASLALGGSAAEIASLREELARRTQEINVEVTEAEPTDPTYLASRLAFAVNTPST